MALPGQRSLLQHQIYSGKQGGKHQDTYDTNTMITMYKYTITQHHLAREFRRYMDFDDSDGSITIVIDPSKSSKSIYSLNSRVKHHHTYQTYYNLKLAPINNTFSEQTITHIHAPRTRTTPTAIRELKPLTENTRSVSLSILKLHLTRQVQ